MAEAAAIIASLQRLTEENAAPESFLDLLESLIAIAPLSLASTFEAGVELYRATKHHQSLPADIEDIWYPPPELTPRGRANSAGQPMFYCTLDPACAVHEVGGDLGQLIVLGKWTTSRTMILHDVGYSASSFERAVASRSIPDRHRAFYESELTDDGRMIKDFISLAFTEPTPNNYAFTSALAEFHLRADEIAGLLYPAVSRQANVDNIALRPEFVRASLRLTSAQLLKIDTFGSGIEGFVFADLSSIEDGNLRWSFRGGGTSNPSGGRRRRIRRSTSSCRRARRRGHYDQRAALPCSPWVFCRSHRVGRCHRTRSSRRLGVAA